MTKTRKFAAFIAAALALLSLAACGDTKTEQGFEAQLFFVSPAYIESGSGEPYVLETRELEPSEKNQYLAVLDELRAPGDGAETALSGFIEIRSVRSSIFGGTLTVDFSSNNLSGSSMEEDLLIGQIVRTLILSYPGVETVQFTVDGLLAETLMGHIGILDAFRLDQADDGQGGTVYTLVPVPCTGFT
jgi:spore germination protein GerM